MDVRRSRALTRFDVWAPTYDDSALQSVYEAAHLATLRAALAVGRPVTRILDIGCGTGRFLYRCRAALPSAGLVGLDKSGAMLAVARDTSSSATWVQGRAEEMPFGEGAFDLVVAAFSIRHWSDPLKASMEIARVLRPNGVFIASDVELGRTPSRSWPAWSETLGECHLWRAGLTCSTRQRAQGYGPVQVLTIISASPACLRRRWHRHGQLSEPMLRRQHDRGPFSADAARAAAPFCPPRYSLMVSPLNRA